MDLTTGLILAAFLTSFLLNGFLLFCICFECLKRRRVEEGRLYNLQNSPVHLGWWTPCSSTVTQTPLNKGVQTKSKAQASMSKVSTLASPYICRISVEEWKKKLVNMCPWLIITIFCFQSSGVKVRVGKMISTFKIHSPHVMRHPPTGRDGRKPLEISRPIPLMGMAMASPTTSQPLRQTTPLSLTPFPMEMSELEMSPLGMGSSSDWVSITYIFHFLICNCVKVQHTRISNVASMWVQVKSHICHVQCCI